MPSRWLLPLSGIDPARVKQEALHAVFSRWFDATLTAHHAKVKPYAISPIDTSRSVIEIGTVTDDVDAVFIREARPSRQLKRENGRPFATISDAPTLIASEIWADLNKATSERAWCLQFLTPTTFRHRNRSSPWPAPETVLHGLADRWRAWCPFDAIELTPAEVRSVWVSDIDGRNEVLQLNGSTVSGFVGRIRYECDGEEVARRVDCLMRLAPYIGVGASVTKGLGVVRLEPTWAPSTRNGKPDR